MSRRNDASLRTYTVSQLARLSGTSVRTLHHYDEIGLLKPASVGDNGYRYYGREEMLRLQQILLHREFGLALGEIGTLLDRVMDKQLYEGFSPEKQAGYEAWIIDKYGEQARPRIDAGRAALAAMSPEQKQDWMAEVAGIEGDLARAMAEGFAADDAALDPVMAAHHAWVGRMWKVPPTATAYAELGVLYSTNPEFRARYEGIRPGLADWMAEAMKRYGERALKG